LDVEWLKRQTRLSAKAENRGVVVTEAGSYLRRIDSCITQLKAQGPSRTCNESKEEEKKGYHVITGRQVEGAHLSLAHPAAGGPDRVRLQAEGALLSTLKGRISK